MILTLGEHFLSGKREIFEVDCDGLARRQVVERAVGGALHVGHLHRLRRRRPRYRDVIVISLHHRYRRQSRDRVQIGLLLDENIHDGLCCL